MAIAYLPKQSHPPATWAAETGARRAPQLEAKSMTERTFRIILGALLLAGLYWDWPALEWTLIGILLFQGVTNWRIPRLVSRLRYGPQVPVGACCSVSRDGTASRYNFEAERLLCLVVAAILAPTYGLWNAQLWVVPWFIGFALFGAGLSGMCPMMLGLKRLGFR